ncbi:MAG TPA: trehalose-phosphatase [Caulobacteraceae bacterium]|nr:trehalose-phosphatase [Caulobacteraceae bacterium]
MFASRPHPALSAPPPLEPVTTALFTDLDGTLAPLQPRPGMVGPDADRRRLLEGLLRRLDGRLAVISGRALADLDRILENRPMAVGAAHGLVRRDAAGRLYQMPAPPALGEARDAVRAFATADRRLLVEDKGLALALHYRRAPEAAEAALDLMRRLAAAYELVVQEGDMVVELRGSGPNKGDAVRAFMGESPFSGATPVFLGDDLTDEDGFAAAAALGGYGVVVGSRRPTLARYAVADIEAALTWLQSALEPAA